MEQVDVSKLSLQELKAMAYDQIAMREVAETNLKMINQEITKKLTPQIEANNGKNDTST
jgi:hypothetical protein